MRIALITGASSGMGQEFCRHADASGRYDCIWAVARRTERLEKLASQSKTPVRPISLDLIDVNSVGMLEDMLREEEARGEAFEVGLLVNAAGFAKLGSFSDVTQEETDRMIALNCRAAVDITRACNPYMHAGGRIIEICSCAGFQPLPYLNIYAATKAFLLSYTRALRFELRGRGIHVTALCPGWVRTEFQKVSQETAAKCAVKHQQPSISAKTAVSWTSFLNRINYPVATCSIWTFLQRVFSKLVPNSLVMWCWEGIRRV